MGEGGVGANILVHPSPNRHAIVGFFMRAIACIMFPSSHAAARNPDLSQIPQSQFRSSLLCRPLFLTKLRSPKKTCPNDIGCVPCIARIAAAGIRCFTQGPPYGRRFTRPPHARRGAPSAHPSLASAPCAISCTNACHGCEKSGVPKHLARRHRHRNLRGILQ